MAPPEEVEKVPVEKVSLKEKLSQGWQGLRKRFRFQLDLRIGERLKALGRPLSAEEAEAALEKQEVAARERKEALGRVWERMKGISVLPSTSAVKDWVDGAWARASAPFGKLTEEEMEAGLAAQKVEIKVPAWLRETSFKEALAKLENPQTRRKVAIGGAITVGCLGMGALVGYEVVGRHGSDFHWVVSQFSGVSQAVQEMLARVPTPGRELPTPVTEVAEETKRVLIEKGRGLAPGDLVQKAKTAVAIVKPPVQVAKEAVKEAVVGKPWGPEAMRQIEKAWAARKEAVEVVKPAVEFVAQKGDSLWSLSRKAISEGSLVSEETMKQYGNQILNAVSRLEAAIRGGSLMKIGETVKLSPELTERISRLVIDVNEAIKTAAPEIPVGKGGYGVAQKLFEAGKITKEQLEAFKLANGIDQAAALEHLKVFLGY